MIMPCMNETSARDFGGSIPFVESGSRLLGSPGAPGCTTAGFAESICRASTSKSDGSATANRAAAAQRAAKLARDATKLRGGAVIFIWVQTGMLPPNFEIFKVLMQ